MPDIRVFGADDSPATRAALRFFRERRIIVRYVDVRRQPLSPVELRRFIDRLGDGALATPGIGGSAGAGASPAAMGAGELAALVRADARLLRLPLVRYGEQMTAGSAEATWKAWLAGRR
jgi:arsenate reductase-like glutaredoxin family protein